MHPNEIVITDYVDGALAPAERADVERHLEACAECRALVRDLREISAAARTLDPRDPPVRGWPRIQRAIKLESERGIAALKAPRPRVWRGPLKPAIAWFAAAAAVVLAAYVGVQYRPAPRTGAPGAAPGTMTATSAAGSAEAAQSVEAELKAAELHYENAIKGLEQIASAEQSALDPRTAATLQKNLAVIDQAISESRAALRVQPASEPAQQSLIDSFKAKIGLLQDTVALINEMRKGNETGAARIVSGIKQKG